MNFKKQSFFLLLIITAITLNAQVYWEELEVPNTRSMHSIETTSEGVLFVGQDGGILRSFDKGENWEFTQNVGLGGAIVYSLLAYTNDSIFAGTSIGIFLSVNKGESWDYIYMIATNVLCMESLGDSLIFAGTWAGIFRSNDKGASWTKVLSLMQSEVVNDLEKNQDMIFAGTTNFTGENPGGVYRSVDFGDTWELIGMDYHFVSSIETDMNDSIYVGTRGQFFNGNGGVFSSSDYGYSWIQKYENNLVTSICINDFNTILIGCSTSGGSGGYPGGVYQSFNNGTTWEDISNGLSNRDIDCIEIGPDYFTYVITYSPYHLYKSVNPITSKNEILINQEDFVIFPNPTSNTLKVRIKQLSYTFKILDVILISNDGYRIKLNNKLSYSCNGNIEIDVSKVPSGSYFVSILTNNSNLCFKIIKL